MFTIIFLWIVCGVISAGLTYAYFQRRWPSLADEDRDRDAAHAYLMFAAGPLGLAVALYFGGFRYGWKLPPPLD